MYMAQLGVQHAIVLGVPPFFPLLQCWLHGAPDSFHVETTLYCEKDLYYAHNQAWRGNAQFAIWVPDPVYNTSTDIYHMAWYAWVRRVIRYLYQIQSSKCSLRGWVGISHFSSLHAESMSGNSYSSGLNDSWNSGRSGKSWRLLHIPFLGIPHKRWIFSENYVWVVKTKDESK